MRARTLLLLAIIGTVVPILVKVVTPAGTPARRTSAEVATAYHASAAVVALGVLRRWDRRRLAAWGSGDLPALRRLYVPSSSAGARDVAELRSWVRRGVRVTGLRQQVASFRVVRRERRLLVVVVTDRTVDGRALGAVPDSRVSEPVPASPWSGHRIRLVRWEGGWRVEDVLGLPPQ